MQNSLESFRFSINPFVNDVITLDEVLPEKLKNATIIISQHHEGDICVVNILIKISEYQYFFIEKQ